MIIHSDWHIHSEFSYDAKIPLSEIAEHARERELRYVGITDHANYNDDKFLADLRGSAKAVNAFSKDFPKMILGVELTPIAKTEFDYIARTHTREGYISPPDTTPFGIELAASKAELIALGVRYAIGASHWRVDIPRSEWDFSDVGSFIKEWHRQQMWLAQDERVTVLGHPWYNGSGLWYEDFSVIPKSMNKELAAALKENGKYVECNSGVICSGKMSEKSRYLYGEMLREFFECGIPVTYGSDAHKAYTDDREGVEKYLLAAGFREGDISEISDKDLW